MAKRGVVLLLSFLCLASAAPGSCTSVPNGPPAAPPASDSASKANDKIVELPGQPGGVDFDQYSGYVTVEDKAGRALFYYFTEASGAGDRSRKPLLLWLTGGPGCSSLVYGGLEEVGPFRVASDGRTLFRNPYSWNQAANVLFLESPAGTGFSYSNTTADYVQGGDQKTADDSHAFLLNWMERFPEYKGRDFYIAGESYAGHYIPQLAAVILQNQNQSSAGNSPVINLKGIMIGNAWINTETDTNGRYDYWWTHALISDSTIEDVHKYCNFSAAAAAAGQTAECNRTLAEADRLVSKMDIYNLYAPLCNSSTVTAFPKPTSMQIENFDPCMDLYVRTYLNRPEVQSALHANTTKLSYPWTECSQLIADNWQDTPPTVLPLIRDLLAKNMRVWVYSGDIDGIVPVTSTRYSLNELKLPIKTPWDAWLIEDQVGGFSVIYEGNLTFVTIKGAGHRVPGYQPARSLIIFNSFLQGIPPPS